jgi:hypothetical protein
MLALVKEFKNVEFDLDELFHPDFSGTYSERVLTFSEYISE